MRNPQHNLQVAHNLADSKRSFTNSRDGELRTVQQPKLFQSETSKLVSILKKPIEQRNGQDNQYLSTLIKQNPALSKLSEQVSVEFVKNLMKEAQIIRPGKDKIIYQKGDPIKNMGVVFTGHLAIIKKELPENQNHIPFQISNEYIFDKLIEIAKTYTRQLRKKQSLIGGNSLKIRRSNSIIQKNFDYLFGDYEKQNDDFIESYINQNEIFGFQDRSSRDIYSHTCVCLSPQTTLLIFKQNNVMTNLQAAFKQKLKKTTTLLKAIPCFNILDLDKLSSIIQSMSTKKKRKFDYVYHQGDPTTHIYLLSEGEIKITKQTHLFQQNPNNLYGNRKKLVEESLLLNSSEADRAEKKIIKRKIDSSILPYADLTLMYNFRPMTKNIQIGVITPFSLFGEEEYCQRRKRDTNAICSSLQTQYYQIGIKKLEEIVGAKLILPFHNELRSSVRKKLLYRQSQYANSIQFQNNNNMNYFYYEDGKEKQSPRKYRINKMNNKMQQKKQSPQRQAQQTTLPTFTTFNFHKMTKSIKSSPKASRSEPESQDESKLEQNPIEMKIMDITHTWQLMKQKVDMQLKTSRRISPNKAIINITKPLIASQFFFQMDREAKRIQRQHRKRIGSVGRNIKLSSISQRSPKRQ